MRFIAAICFALFSFATIPAAANEIGGNYDIATAAPVRMAHVSRHGRHHLAQADLRDSQRVQPWAMSTPADSGGLTSRPRDCYGIQWCGCYLRHVFGLADTALNLARNWASLGSNAGGPHVGAVAVGSHHVAKIVGEPDGSGLWLIQDGNDGPVRVHRASLGWAHWFRSI
jgi:hypothetical protein